MPSVHDADDLVQAACPKILIYGEPGVGKTSLALEFPSPFFLSLENGLPKNGSVKGFGPDKLPDYNSVLDTLTSLYNDEHEFKTIIIDTMSVLQTYIFTHVCKKNRWDSIEDAGYGKGYVAASETLDDLIVWLKAINDLGIAIVLIGHSVVKGFNDPESVVYDRYQIDMNKSLVTQVQKFTDCILLIKKDAKVQKDDEKSKFNNRVHAEGGQVRWIHTDGKAAFIAKNRYEMPPRILYERGNGYGALSQYFYGI